jgi:hypothetical protein
MALIDRLVYPAEVEIMNNRPTYAKVPDHVMRLGHTTECPYCGSRMKNVKHDIIEAFGGVWAQVLDECTGCGWWRSREFPNNFVNGFWRIGLLYEMPEKTASNVSARLLEFIKDENRLFRMEASEFEFLVGEVLSDLYRCEVVHVGRTGDGGIDLILLESDVGKIPVQVKRRTDSGKVEGVSIIREFRGAMVLTGASEGMFVTTAQRFTKGAQDASLPAPGHLVQQKIHLMDGRRFLDVMGVLKSASKRKEYIWEPTPELRRVMEAATKDPYLVARGALAYAKQMAAKEKAKEDVARIIDEYMRREDEI